MPGTAPQEVNEKITVFVVVHNRCHCQGSHSPMGAVLDNLMPRDRLFSQHFSRDDFSLSAILLLFDKTYAS